MKPRLLIVGQKGKRHDELEREFGDEARIAFHEKDANVHRLADQARGADVAFVCVNATGHSAINVLKTAGTPIKYINGAASELKTAIRDWLNVFTTNQGRAA